MQNKLIVLIFQRKEEMMEYAILFRREYLPVLILVMFFIAGCGGDGTDSTAVVTEVSGTIEADDMRDPDHGNLAYDSYEFEAGTLDQVRVEVSTESFLPLLELVEVSTGAVIAEWEPEYSSDDALNYTIAGPGSYEARVYAQEDGSGVYSLSIAVSP